MLSINHFFKSYGNKKIFEDVNVKINDRGVYGIVGKNGSGKTTFFNCLLGLEKYTGQIIHSEYVIFKNMLGYVPTELFFFSRVTGLEYIMYMLVAKQIKPSKRQILESNIFNLPLKKYISTYSNGMKKMLAITAVLLQRNKWFILDEPFNGVDIENNILLVKTIEKLKQENKTVLISSHILETLFSICDVIFLIKNKNMLEYPKKKFSQISDDLISG